MKRFMFLSLFLLVIAHSVVYAQGSYLCNDSLRILNIGNSFTNNSTVYLKNMVECAGINTDSICIYKYTRGVASFHTVHDCWNDNDEATYAVEKVLGNLDQNISGIGNSYDGSILRSAIKNCKWDVIIIQQTSQYSNEYGVWNGHGPGGYLKEFMDTLRKYQPLAEIGISLPHSSYLQNHDTNERHYEIANSVKEFCKDYNVDFVIPYGTAVQNIRMSRINTTKYGFSVDMHHLAEGVGCYVANAAYFEAVFKPRYGISIIGNSFRFEVPEEVLLEANYPEECISVTDENAHDCQMAAVLSVKDMFVVTNPDDYTSSIEYARNSIRKGRKHISNNQIVIENSRCFYNTMGVSTTFNK